MSNAVPWSTEVRTMGRPSVTLTACAERQQLDGNQALIMVAGDRPRRIRRGARAGRPCPPAAGPARRCPLPGSAPPPARARRRLPSPSARARRRAGSAPASASRGAATPNRGSSRAVSWMCARRVAASAARGTSRQRRRGRSPVRPEALGDSNIIATNGRVRSGAPSRSVCPRQGSPASANASLLTGAVAMASTRRACASSHGADDRVVGTPGRPAAVS